MTTLARLPRGGGTAGGNPAKAPKKKSKNPTVAIDVCAAAYLCDLNQKIAKDIVYYLPNLRPKVCFARVTILTYAMDPMESLAGGRVPAGFDAQAAENMEDVSQSRLAIMRCIPCEYSLLCKVC